MIFTDMLAHQEKWNHGLCRCGGYHYSHRPGSKFCDSNPMAPLHRAMRENAEDRDLMEIEMECVMLPGRPLKVWPED